MGSGLATSTLGRRSASDRGGSVHSEISIIHEIANLFHAALKAFVSDIARDSGHQVTPAQLRTLQLLAMKPAISLAEVARGMAVTTASACIAVGRLVDVGWVSQTTDPRDRRVRRVRLTAKGRALVKQIERLQARKVAALVEHFTPEELSNFRRIACRITERIDDMQEGKIE